MAILFLISISFLSPSCKKDVLKDEFFFKKDLISDARSYFEKEVLTLHNEIPNDQNARHQLKKSAIWELARIKKISIGEVIIVPLKYDRKVFFKTNYKERTIGLENTSYLLIYRDKKSRYHAEWVTMAPDESNGQLNKFIGIGIIEDWNGNFIKSFYYGFDNKVISLQESGAFSFDKAAYRGIDCATTEIWTIVYTPYSTHYRLFGYETHCVSSGDVGGGNTNPGGTGVNQDHEDTPAPEDYSTGYVVTIADLESAILDKPFGLFENVPCDVLRAWLNTANFKPSSSIIGKLNTIKNSMTNLSYFGEKVARIQMIDAASSPVVNLDYFPVNISQMPTVNNQLWTAENLNHYIRTHLNELTNGTKVFNPYNAYGVDDNALWASTSPFGSILTLDLRGPENGSVITSKADANGWTFSTIFEPMYGEHPVSGNRDFGFATNTDGTVTFFTRGADRLTAPAETLMEVLPTFLGFAKGVPFTAADNLWKSYQSGIKKFVEDHGGVATVQTPQTYRPDWDIVKDVIEGRKPLSSLSKNCPD